MAASKNTYASIELDEQIDGKTLRQFVLNEDSFAKRTLSATLPVSLKKSTFLTVFLGIVKEFIEKYKPLLFPLATAITFFETRQAWKNYKEKHNQNFAAKWDLFMTVAMAAKEATAVIISLVFTAVSALVAPFIFLFLIGRSVINSLVAVCGNLKNMWNLWRNNQTFSAQYAAEKAALKNNLDNFIVSATLWVAILTSFLAPQFVATFGGLLGAAYAINMTTIGVLAASTARSVYNTVTELFGFNKKKSTDNHTNEYLNINNFKSLKDSHIDDLLLKLEYSFKKDPANESAVKVLLRNWIKQETDITNFDDNERETKQNNAKKDFLNELTLILNKQSEKTIIELINNYRHQANSPLKLIMTSEHGNISGTQKLTVLFDKLVELREKHIQHNISSMIFPVNQIKAENTNLAPVLKAKKVILNEDQSDGKDFLGVSPTTLQEIFPKKQSIKMFKEHDLWHTNTYQNNLAKRIDEKPSVSQSLQRGRAFTA